MNRSPLPPPAPATRRTQSPIEEVLRLAGRAPSVHNTQPWLWRIRDRRVDLFADLSRQLGHTDPSGRDLMLSCGAALHHLQVAARGLGWQARVRRLPDAADPRHLASITLSPCVAAPEAVERMQVIQRRQTDRRRFTSWPVPPERLAALAEVAGEWGARAVPVTDPRARARLRTLTRRADQVQRDDPDYQTELEAQVRRGPDGLSPDALPAAGSGANRTFPQGALDDPSRDPLGDPEGLLLVCTPADDTLSQLRAGEALSAVWLRAAAEGLSVMPLSQALEVDQTRRAVAGELLEHWGFPQIVLRVGWPPIMRQGLVSSGRRPLEECLLA